MHRDIDFLTGRKLRQKCHIENTIGNNSTSLPRWKLL